MALGSPKSCSFLAFRTSFSREVRCECVHAKKNVLVAINNPEVDDRDKVPV